jgi:hypothetical protein
MSLLAPERPVATAEQGDRPDHSDARPQGPTTATLLRLVAAGCLAGAAAIHFGYAPAHFDEYWAYGAFFVAAGCVQLLCAAALVGRPSRWMLWATSAVNVAIIAVWVVSRRVGALVGPNASDAEPMRYPDILATVLEAVAVECCLLLLFRLGAAGRRWRRWPAVLAPVGAIAVVGATVGYALTPRFTASHAHGSEAVNHNDAAPHAASTAGLTGTTPCELSGPPSSPSAEGHSHRGPLPQKPIDRATALTLQAQQEVARQVATKYPTVADATSAGYGPSTVYVPCIGAHYTNIPLARRFDVAAPSELLYDGSTPDARIVGLSYLVWHPGGAPEGFAGPNDVWHQHTFNGGLCINGNGLVVGNESTSPEQCRSRGGIKVPLTDIWMLHDWVVPGFECSWGVFAAECPELGGRLNGTAWDTPNPNARLN